MGLDCNSINLSVGNSGVEITLLAKIHKHFTSRIENVCYFRSSIFVVIIISLPGSRVFKYFLCQRFWNKKKVSLS